MISAKKCGNKCLMLRIESQVAVAIFKALAAAL